MYHTNCNNYKKKLVSAKIPMIVTAVKCLGLRIALGEPGRCNHETLYTVYPWETGSRSLQEKVWKQPTSSSPSRSAEYNNEKTRIEHRAYRIRLNKMMGLDNIGPNININQTTALVLFFRLAPHPLAGAPPQNLSFWRGGSLHVFNHNIHAQKPWKIALKWFNKPIDSI